MRLCVAFGPFWLSERLFLHIQPVHILLVAQDVMPGKAARLRDDFQQVEHDAIFRQALKYQGETVTAVSGNEGPLRGQGNIVLLQEPRTDVLLLVHEKSGWPDTRIHVEVVQTGDVYQHLSFLFHKGEFLGNKGSLDVGIGQRKLKHGARKYRRREKI